LPFLGSLTVEVRPDLNVENIRRDMLDLGLKVNSDPKTLAKQLSFCNFLVA
jgi:hypothetical protein